MRNLEEEARSQEPGVRSQVLVGNSEFRSQNSEGNKEVRIKKKEGRGDKWKHKLNPPNPNPHSPSPKRSFRSVRPPAEAGSIE